MADGPIDQQLLAFGDELLVWLQEGGDERLKSFWPLESWGKIVERIAQMYAAAEKAAVTVAMAERPDKLN